MLIKCRWCDVTKNGALSIKEHERTFHPKEYYLLKAENLEIAAGRNLQEAQHLRDKYGK